jgi:hypothetical protein
MNGVVALGVTAVLWAVAVVASLATDSQIPVLVIVLGSAVWAAVDSSRLELKKYNSGIDHPLLVFLGITFFWIIFFPSYLVVRSRLANGELHLKRNYREPGQAKAEEIPEPVGPRPWVRAVVYGGTCLPAFVMLLGCLPQFGPIFARLEQKGQLPELTRWLVAFARLNALSLYLPVLALVLALAAIDQAAVSRLRRRARGSLWSWIWVIAVALGGVVCQLLVVAGLLLPVIQMGRNVG